MKSFKGVFDVVEGRPAAWLAIGTIEGDASATLLGWGQRFYIMAHID
jgi:hypothetical protein